MKAYLAINVLFVFFQILLDDPCILLEKACVLYCRTNAPSELTKVFVKSSSTFYCHQIYCKLGLPTRGVT